MKNVSLEKLFNAKYLFCRKDTPDITDRIPKIHTLLISSFELEYLAGSQIMASSILSKEKQAIAQNLIETCGLERAFHAAKQYGWHDIANSINEKLNRPEVPKLRH